MFMTRPPILERRIGIYFDYSQHRFFAENDLNIIIAPTNHHRAPKRQGFDAVVTNNNILTQRRRLTSSCGSFVALAIFLCLWPCALLELGLVFRVPDSVGGSSFLEGKALLLAQFGRLGSQHIKEGVPGSSR